MKKTITFYKIYESGGQKSAKSLSFEAEVEKFMKYQTVDAVKKQLKAHALGMKIMTKAELESAKCSCSDFIEAWKEQRQKEDEAFASLDPNRITPATINVLRTNEVFVFGSNLEGQHAGGAARAAYKYFGAIMGQGVGLQGQSYAIPTMHGGPDAIKPYVDEFIEFAKQHPEKKFLVTPIGCGIAGFKVEAIAPLFKDAKEVNNISLPHSFWYTLR